MAISHGFMLLLVIHLLGRRKVLITEKMDSTDQIGMFPICSFLTPLHLFLVSPAHISDIVFFSLLSGRI